MPWKWHLSPRKQSSLTLLTDIEVPQLYAAQWDNMTYDKLHVVKAYSFRPEEAVERLGQSDGKRVLAADFGGDKGATRLFDVSQGKLCLSSEYVDDIQGDEGAGYLQSFEKAAGFAELYKIPMGISWGAQLDGTKLLPGPKSKIFVREFGEKYNYDFAALSPQVTACLNDGPAGVISGAVESFQRFGARNVIFAINGGGLGLGVLKDGVIYATESGHCEATPELNDYAQNGACGVFGETYLCLEQLGANKAGIEAQWQAITGEYSRAKEIEDRYKEGNQLALELYEHSAFVVAHMIQGAALAFDLALDDPDTAIVCHGGAFKFPSYGDRVQQILSKANQDVRVQCIMAKDYVDPASNACIDGAAIVALIA